MSIDAVQRILAIVEQVAPLGDARPAADALLRAELGGAALRIQRRPPVTIEDINRGLFARMPVREIAEELGVSRATIYRKLSPRSRKQGVRGDKARR